MKATKIAVLPVILLAFLTLGGCVTIGQKSTIKRIADKVSLHDKKVYISSFTIVGKDMQTKKTDPDENEKATGREIYSALQNNLSQKGILDQNNIMDNAIEININVHYALLSVTDWLSGTYYKDATFERLNGPKILVTRVIFRDRGGKNIVELNSVDSTGALFSKDSLIKSTVDTLANDIEKILKEGVSVGKSP